jgi:hypothetical protein
MKIFVSTALDLEVEEGASVTTGNDMAESAEGQTENGEEELEVQRIGTQVGIGNGPPLSDSLRCVTSASACPWKSQASRRRKHEMDSRPAMCVNSRAVVQSEDLGCIKTSRPTALEMEAAFLRDHAYSTVLKQCKAEIKSLLTQRQCDEGMQ